MYMLLMRDCLRTDNTSTSLQHQQVYTLTSLSTDQ